MAKKIAKWIIIKLSHGQSFATNRVRKAEYILTVFLSELFKMLLLAGIFFSLGKGPNYIVSLITVLMTKSFAGGFHHKSQNICFIHSTLFFVGVYLIDVYVPVPGWMWIMISIITLILYFFYAPRTPSTRGSYGPITRRRLKIFSLLSVGCLIAFMAVSEQYRKVITCTLLILDVEYTCLIKRR